MGERVIAVIAIAGLLGLGSIGAQDKKEEKRDPVLEAYYQANGLFNRKLYTLAADGYREFLAKHPNHAKAPAARSGLAMSVFRQKKYGEAAPLIAPLAADPKHPQAEALLLMHAQCLLETGKVAEAEKVFAEGRKRGGKDLFKLRCQAGQIDALYRQKKWKEVSANTSEFLKSAGQGALATRVRTQSAMADYELKNYAGAAAALQTLGADKKALGQQGVFLFAECKRQLGDRNAARAGYETARTMEGPYVAEALYRLGYLEFQDKKHDQAIRLFEELRDQHTKAPMTEASRILLGRAWYEKKGYGQAKAVFGSMGSAEGESWRARCSLREKNLNEAESVLRAAIAKYPNDTLLPELRFDLGTVLFQGGKFPEAAVILGELVAAHPKFAKLGEARRMRAYCLHRENKHAESLAECEAALKAGAEGSAQEELAFLRAENLFLLDRGVEAAAAYREFVAKHGSSKQAGTAKLRIGQVLYADEKWQEAGVVFDALVQGNPKREGAFADLDFFAGECAFGSGAKPKAVTHYERFLAVVAPDAPYRDTALYKLGALFAELKREADAKRVYGELAAKFPQSPHRPAALLELGRLHHAAKDYGGAKGQLNLFVGSYPEHPLRPRAEYYLGWVALAEKRDPEARKHFAMVVAKPEAAGAELAADAGFQLAMLAVRAKDYPAAAVALERLSASEKDPARRDEVTYYLGISRARQKQWAPAREAFLKLGEKVKPELRERALYELAWCQKELKQLEEAKKSYLALATDYANGSLATTALLELAELECESGDRAAATNRLAPLLTSSDRALAARAAYRLGWCYYEDAKFSEAAKAFEVMLGIAEAPANLVPVAAYQVGEAKLKAKDFAGALPHYKRAAEEAEKLGDAIAEQAWLRLAEAQGIVGGHNDSLATCDRFLAKYPKSDYLTRVQFAKGWALENIGRRAEAIAEYGRVLAAGKRDETSARSQFQTGECYLAENKFDDAIKAFVQVEVSFGNGEWTPKALLEIGTALDRKGESAKAKAQYEDLLKKFPETPSATVAKQRLGRK